MRDPMNYTKASGMMLAKKYLPNSVPFEDVIVIKTLSEWEEIKDQYGDFIVYRSDTQLGAPRKNVVAGTNGFTDSLPDLIEKVNREDPDGVVLILPTKEQPVPRYEYGGGFCVLFELGKSVTIETVGEGFDGHELTRGLAAHERWCIPWDRIYSIDKDLSEWWYRKDGKQDTLYYPVNAEKYAEQRQARIDFLCNECHYDPDLVNKHVPEKHHSITGKLIAEHLTERVIWHLVEREVTLARAGLFTFTVQGNFVHCKDARSEPQVWEIFQMPSS